LTDLQLDGRRGQGEVHDKQYEHPAQNQPEAPNPEMTRQEISCRHFQREGYGKGLPE